MNFCHIRQLKDKVNGKKQRSEILNNPALFLFPFLCSLRISPPLHCHHSTSPPSASPLASRHSYLRGHESLPLLFILSSPPLIRPLPSPSFLPLPLFSHFHLSLAFLSLSTSKKAGGRSKKKKGELVLCALGLSLCSAKRTQLLNRCSGFGTKGNLKSCKKADPYPFPPFTEWPLF